MWVPVETPSSLYTTVDAGIALAGSTGVKTTKYTNSEIISGTKRGLPGSTASREPDILTSTEWGDSDESAKTAGFSSLVNMAETMKNDYEEMIASLEKYKGFYIGRYELTANGEKTGATQTDVNWYTSYKNCTTLASGSKVKTRMIWGLQWDATCKWLDSSGFNITNSSTWGNYRGNTATGHGSMQNTGFGLDVAITGEGFLQVMDADGNILPGRLDQLPASGHIILLFLAQRFILFAQHHNLCTLRFQQVHDVVVGQWGELNQNLTDNADPRLTDRFIDGEAVKRIDDSTAYFLIGVLRF